MPNHDITWSVFTKPWRDLALPKLGALVREMGYQAVELPVRPGYQVLPENVARDLPPAARILAEEGVAIASVAGPADEVTIAACAEAGVPVLRVMAQVAPGRPYQKEEARLRHEYDALLPLLEQHGVTLGVQNHLGDFIGNAVALDRLLAPYPPGGPGAPIAAVWDAAHEALCGVHPEHALDIIWPRLCLVNLKNAFWQRTNGPEAEQAAWRSYWTSGRHGLADWRRVLAELVRRRYQGVVCITAEYSDHDAVAGGVKQLARNDLAYARTLLQEVQA